MSDSGYYSSRSKLERAAFVPWLRVVLSTSKAPLLGLLETRSGFHFAIVCLCLLSLAIGMVFHRSLNSLVLVPISDVRFVQEDGRTLLGQIDAAIHRVNEADSTVPDDMNALEQLSDLTARLHRSVRATLDLFGNAEPAHGLEASSIALFHSLASVDAIVAQYRLAGSSKKTADEVSRALDRSLRELRTVFSAFLEDVSPNADMTRARLVDGIAMLALCLRISLGLITLIGIVFLSFLREEIVKRIAREKFEMETDSLAYQDTLTGLANRFHFNHKLASHLASGKPYSIILIDIDSFREFNERFGTSSGDVVLKEIAYRIASRADDVNGFAARLSGDEFAILLTDSSPTYLKEVCSRLSAECSQPVIRACQVLSVSVSIGSLSSKCISASCGKNNEDLIRLADFALASARTEGTGKVVYLDEDLERSFNFRRAVSSGLSAALENNWIQLHFQPQIDITNDVVCGFEASIRWDLEGTQVPTSQLIELAEESGLISEVHQYVLEQSIKTMSSWNRSHRTCYSVSINVSALHFVEPDTLAFIVSCLDRYCLPPNLLTLEISEIAQLAGDERSLLALKRLRDLGCRLSIDDLGAGLSAFGYLRRLRVDEVKIDRTFVSEIESASTDPNVLGAITGLADCLGLSVVVAGIETLQQGATAENQGAKRVQGLAYGKPKPALEWLADATYRGRYKPSQSAKSASLSVG